MVSKTSFLCEKRVVRPGKELQPESSTAAGSSQPRREVGRSKPQDPAIECLRLAARKSPTSTQNTGAGDPCFVQSSRNSKHPRPLRLLHQFSRLLSSSWSLTGPGRNMGRTSPKISREQEEEIKKRKNKNKKQKQARAAGHRSSFALSPTQHKLAFAGPARGSGRQEPRDVPSLSGVWSPAEVSREHMPWMFASSVDALAEKNWRLSFGTCRLGCFGRHQSCVLRYSDLNFFFFPIVSVVQVLVGGLTPAMILCRNCRGFHATSLAKMPPFRPSRQAKRLGETNRRPGTSSQPSVDPRYNRVRSPAMSVHDYPYKVGSPIQVGHNKPGLSSTNSRIKKKEPSSKYCTVLYSTIQHKRT